MENTDVLPVLPDPQLERYGNLYRILCRRQGNDVLMIDGSPVIFAAFIFSMEAEQDRGLRFHGVCHGRRISEGMNG